MALNELTLTVLPILAHGRGRAAHWLGLVPLLLGLISYEMMQSYERTGRAVDGRRVEYTAVSVSL